MKVKTIPTPEPPPIFKPVQISLTFETKEELDEFQGVIRSGGIHHLLRELGQLKTAHILTLMYNELESHTNITGRFSTHEIFKTK